MLEVNFALSNVYLIEGCKLFRHVENYLKSGCFGQKIKPPSMHCLKTSLMNSHSSTENYFRNSWVKSLFSSWDPIVRQAYGGAHLVAMTVPKTWLNILESNKKLSFFKINLIESIMNCFVKHWGIKLRFLLIQQSMTSIPSSIGIEVYKISMSHE